MLPKKLLELSSQMALTDHLMNGLETLYVLFITLLEQRLRNLCICIAKFKILNEKLY